MFHPKSTKMAKFLATPPKPQKRGLDGAPTLFINQFSGWFDGVLQQALEAVPDTNRNFIEFFSKLLNLAPSKASPWNRF